MTTHESFDHHSTVQTSSNRGFGLTVGGILVAIGALRALLGSSGFDGWSIALLSVGGVLVIAGLLFSSVLAPLNRAWTALGLLLFKVVNPIVLMLIFAVAVVPTAIIMRALGHDPLNLRRSDEKETYWVDRSTMRLGEQDLKNQF